MPPDLLDPPDSDSDAQQVTGALTGLRKFSDAANSGASNAQAPSQGEGGGATSPGKAFACGLEALSMAAAQASKKGPKPPRARAPPPPKPAKPKPEPATPPHCHSCGATETPKWRCGMTLCNACGLRASESRKSKHNRAPHVLPNASMMGMQVQVAMPGACAGQMMGYTMMGTMLHPCAIPMVSLPHGHAGALPEGYRPGLACGGAPPMAMPPGAGFALVDGAAAGHAAHPGAPQHMYAFIDPSGHGVTAAAVSGLPSYMAAGEQHQPAVQGSPVLNPDCSTCAPAAAAAMAAHMGAAHMGGGMGAHGLCFPFPQAGVAQASFPSK